MVAGRGSSDGPETVSDPSQKGCLEGWDSVSQISICIWLCAFGDGVGRLLMHVNVCTLWALGWCCETLFTRTGNNQGCPWLYTVTAALLFASWSQRRALCFCHCIPDPRSQLVWALPAAQHFSLTAFMCCIAVRAAVPCREAINCSSVFVFRV